MRKPSTSGMTLVEIVIAATLLTFVIMGGITALTAGMKFVQHARMTTLMSQITQSAIEHLRLSNFETLKGYAARTQPVSFNNVLTADNFSSGFTATVNVHVAFSTQIASTSGTLGQIQAKVTTLWTESGAEYTREATTIFTEKGLSDYIYAGWNQSI